ncbi:asparagine synthase-related protein [Thermophagus sp. OGC60D27]|uniref:asparagine synthase-related protein n=1 Tax=Thermophagus sp. OGC60D27 TaxID=3458415 RepID=UPI004037935F
MEQYSKIMSFLELGYFLDYPKQIVRLPKNITQWRQHDLTQEELFKTVRQRLLKSFAAAFSPGQTCVVPLSGGLDSRAVLGGLLQFTDASNIVTYTYGIPGSFDYEIAARVARSVGVNNIQIPLEKYDYSLDELLDVSRSMDHQTLLFYHAPYRIIKRDFSSSVHWSGFLGEAITGDHIRGILARSMNEAELKFLDGNAFVKGADQRLLEGGRAYSYEKLVRPLPEQGFLTYEEGLDLLNRQNKYIAPHVMLNGFDHRAPFNEPELIGFFLGLKEEQKRDQTFFKEFLQWWKPNLFALPVKNNLGLPLGASGWRIQFRKKMFGVKKRLGRWKDPNINYFNFSERLVVDDKFKNLIKSQLSDLQQRKILPETINPDILWQETQNNIQNHGNLILGLVSLEIHLKAGKKL